jgi:hypothetical protein
MSNHGWADLTRRQADVAEEMRAIGGPCTADDISAWVEEHEGRHVGASLTSRLHELVDRGVVEATGDRAATRSGRTVAPAAVRVCDRCDGYGWRTVPPEYVARMVRVLERRPVQIPARAGEPVEAHAARQIAAQDARDREVARMERSHAESVTPCPHCRPRSAARWAEGHWSPGHDRAGCVDCGGRSNPDAGRYDRVETRERRDTDG